MTQARRRLRLGMCVAVAATTVALGVGEWIARRAYGTGFSYLVDPFEDHSYRPKARVQHDWGDTMVFETNSLGWKDSSRREIDKEPAGRRVVVLGDSFVEGVGLTARQTIPAQLEESLGRRGDPAEVLNGGTSSFCPLLYYQRLKRFFARGYKADQVVVFVDLSDFPDELYYGPRFTYDPAGEPQRIAGWRNHPLARSATNNLALVRGLVRAVGRSGESVPAAATPSFPSANDTLSRPVLSFEELNRARPDVVSALRGAWPLHEPSVRGWAAEGAQRVSQNLTRILALSRRHGADLTVVVYPWPQIAMRDPEQLPLFDRTFGRHGIERRLVTSLPAPTDTPYQAFVRSWCESRQVEIVDLVPVIQRERNWHELYIPGDVHFNARGARLVADSIAARLTRPGRQANRQP